jgi:hypothetical protein
LEASLIYELKLSKAVCVFCPVWNDRLGSSARDGDDRMSSVLVVLPH